jgi:hypothetical protein
MLTAPAVRFKLADGTQQEIAFGDTVQERAAVMSKMRAHLNEVH